MRSEERKKIEQFFKTRVGREESTVRKMLLSHPEGPTEQKPWIKELAKVLSSQIDAKRIPVEWFIRIADVSIVWEPYPEQLLKRNCHTSILYNDKLYILGGYDGKGITGDAIIFDICILAFPASDSPQELGNSDREERRTGHQGGPVRAQVGPPRLHHLHFRRLRGGARLAE